MKSFKTVQEHIKILVDRDLIINDFKKGKINKKTTIQWSFLTIGSGGGTRTHDLPGMNRAL